MKVVHIQYSMPPSGNAAYRLHEAMRAVGIDSWMLTLESGAKKDFSLSIQSSFARIIRKGINALWRRCQTIGLKKNVYFYSALPLLGNGVAKHPLVQDADAIYLHWIAGGSTTMADLIALAEMRKPVFVFLHDMWAFTGGCHHSFECMGYQNSCTHCPMFRKENYGVRKQLAQKAQVYACYPNIRFISPGEWMYERASHASALKCSSLHRIPNLVDEKVFKHIDKSVARDILNLPHQAKLITFGCASGIYNRIKGWSYLRDALNMIDMEGTELVVYGSGYDAQAEKELKCPVHFMGCLLDDTMLSLVCNASDLFVSPSLCENYSLAVVENLVVGTPVVAFANTGTRELVIKDKTGYLANYKDTADLAEGIKSLLEHPLKVKGWECFHAVDIVKMHQDLLKLALSQTE